MTSHILRFCMYPWTCLCLEPSLTIWIPLPKPPVKSFSHVWLFVSPWTAAHQDSLSTTNSWSLLKLMSMESVMPSNPLILCHSFLLPHSIISPGSGYFPVSQFLTSGGQSIGGSYLASVLPMNIQDWFPIGWTGWISLLPKRLSRVVSNTTVQKHQFFSSQLSLQSNSYICTWLLYSPTHTPIHTWKTIV